MKQFYFILIFFLLVSCRKENHFIPDYLKNQFHQKNVINHQSFKALFTSFLRNLILIKGATIEPSEIVKNQIKFQLSKSVAIFLLQNPKFLTLTSDERAREFEYLKQIVKNDNSYKTDLYNLDKSFLKNIHTNTLSTDNLYVQNNISRLSNDELFGCVLETIGGAIASYGDSINDIRRLISYGFSGRLLLDATMDIISSASPWWKVAGLSISFGACIYSAYD